MDFIIACTSIVRHSIGLTCDWASFAGGRRVGTNIGGDVPSIKLTHQGLDRLHCAILEKTDPRSNLITCETDQLQNHTGGEPDIGCKPDDATYSETEPTNFPRH